MPLASSLTFEYVSEELDVKGSGFEQFAEVFARFQPPEEASVCCDLFRLSLTNLPTAG